MLLALQPQLDNGWAIPAYVATVYTRTAADSVPVTADTAVRVATFYRVGSVSALDLTAVALRVATYIRRSTEHPTVVDNAQQVIAIARTATDSVDVPTTTPRVGRLYARTANDATVPADYPNVDGFGSISGVVRNVDGTPYLGGAVVQLIRDSDGLRCQVITSSLVNGSYYFGRDSRDPYTYTVRAFTGDPREDITRSGLVPVVVYPD